MEQQVFYIHNLLTNILGKENQPRRKSEAQLMTLKKESPAKCGLYMIKIMQESQDQSVRLLTAVLLRRFVSVILDEDNSIWKSLSQEDRSVFKQQCLLSLENQKTKIVRIRICDLVAELGGSIFQCDEKHWTELLLQISQYLQSDSQLDLEIAFRICESYIPYAFDQFKEHFKILSTVIEKSITSENYNLAEAAVDCFASICSLIEEDDLKSFGNLVVPLLQLPVRAINSGDQEAGRVILITLTDIVQTQPKFFGPNIDLICQMSNLIIKADLCDPDIKTLPVQLMVYFVQKSTKFVKQNKKFLESLFEIILKLMVESDEEPTNEWMNPPDGFSMKEAEEADEMIKSGRTWVDNLIAALGTEITLPMISQIIEHALLNQEQQSWQWKAAALMVVSQVGQYIDCEEESVEKIKHIIPVIVNHIQHKHPKVRYAASHAIGQISDDMRPDFQENFHQIVMPAMYQLLNDSIPRIVAHAGGCLANVIQGMEKQIVEPYMEQFLKRFMELLQSPQTCSLIKEGAAASITSIVQAAQDKFTPFFQNMMNILLVGIQNMNTKSLINLRGHCIECVSMLIRSVGKQCSKPFIERVVNIFSGIVDSKQNMDDGDITRSFIFSAWGRICRIFEEDLSPYMNKILPGLFQMAQQKVMVIGTEGNELDLNTGQDKALGTKVQQNKSEASNSQISAALKEMVEFNKSTKDRVKENKVKFSLSTAISQEKSIAIEMIATFVEHMNADTLIQYIQKFSELAMVLTNENLSNEVRQIASNTLVTLITKLKKTKLQQQGNQSSVIECAKIYIKTLWGALRTESDNETIVTQLHAINSIIDEVGIFLEVDEINQMGEKLMLIIKQSEERKEDNERLKKNDDVEQNDINLLDQDNENEEDVQISVAQLFGTLFKTHKQRCSSLISALSQRVIPNWMSDKFTNKAESQNKKKLAIYILDDVIQYIGPKLMGAEFYNNCVQLFLKYSSHSNHELRQAAAYGVGISSISGTIPQQNLNFFNPFAQNSFKVLINSIKQFPKPKGKKKKNKKINEWGHAKDNSIAAIGKILKHYASLGDSAQMWLSAWAPCLPLQFDSGEGVPQHQYLLELIGKDQESMIGLIGGLPKCLQIFGKILFTRFINEETYKAIQMILHTWGQNTTVQEEITKIVKGNDFKQRWVNRIERCLKNEPYKQWSEGIDGEKLEDFD